MTPTLLPGDALAQLRTFIRAATEAEGVRG